MKTIGVDIDNTIAMTNPSLSLMLFGTTEIPKHLQGVSRWPVSPVDSLTWWASSEGLSILANTRPYRGAAEVLSNLAKNGWRIVYITARPENAKMVTLRWLNNHNFPKGTVRFTGDKASTCLELNVSLLIEDDPIYLQQVSDADISVLIKAHPYNRSIKGPRFLKWEALLPMARQGKILWHSAKEAIAR